MSSPADINTQLNLSVEQIRNAKGYSAEGKRVLIARAYQRRMQEMAELRSAANTALSKERDTLVRDLFGLDRFVNLTDPTGSRASLAVSYRDAQDRVARLEREDEALELLARADRSGDEILARAVVERSVEQQWLGVLNTYADARPGTEPKLQRLIDMDSLNMRDSLAREMSYSVAAPAEVAGLVDSELNRLADTDVHAGTAVGAR
jgi:hypothetical protein